MNNKIGILAKIRTVAIGMVVMIATIALAFAAGDGGSLNDKGPEPKIEIDNSTIMFIWFNTDDTDTWEIDVTYQHGDQGGSEDITVTYGDKIEYDKGRAYSVIFLVEGMVAPDTGSNYDIIYLPDDCNLIYTFEISAYTSSSELIEKLNPIQIDFNLFL